ncbi:MAG: twin-arginine translocation signal domain-containing protein, partial [Deltaproteobacteria bacterium]|nr:twin-arginine translocation signal domain-containing protein [Deltaproteobacteria bacterium]
MKIKKAEQKVTRRDFLRGSSSLGVASIVATAGLMANTDDAQAKASWAEWFQGNYRLMTDEEKKESAQRLEQRYSDEFGKNVTVD